MKLAPPLEPGTFRVLADFPVDGVAAGMDLADQFRRVAPGVWEYRLARRVTELPRSTLRVSVRDLQGNETRVERAFRVGSTAN
jgi:hypothetical protein